ncbi:2OG-Fe(II) oxygenase family oxidoreductase [Aspergillus bertholletiae]|uniref:2OG-Fe(II) oxygenase family oxidoreductase n=1 Tax=Aspergillus bertholletiae TaxID=1226010 RepID=A0A5N7B4T0_9EURO|nr:2OG-Fe(II) oxygenase family oxidoreductase [Aspergillus bertholletiae]
MDQPHRPEHSEAGLENIPIIDVAPLHSADLGERRRLATEIYDACTRVGFFYIKNHGISEELIGALHGAARQFFALPDNQKMEYSVAKSKKYRGFMPVYAEEIPATDSPSGLVEQNPTGALLESFDIGYEILADPQRTADDVLPPDTYDLYGDNQWPSDEVLPKFRDTYLRYCAEALTLCRSLMRNFALALGLDEGFFDPVMNFPGVTSRLLHYPPQPVEGEVRDGLGAHTDYECFTILSQDTVPALQIRNAQGEWIVAPPIPRTLVVNIADCLSMWTNKTFKSTVHRVVNLTGQERYSIPFFFGVDYNTTVSVLPNCISQDRPACVKPFKAGEFVRAQLAKTYVAYGEEPSAKRE